MFTAEYFEELSAWAHTRGVEAEARKLCVAAGEDPDPQLTEYGPNWFRFATSARKSLGLPDDYLEPETPKGDFIAEISHFKKMVELTRRLKAAASAVRRSPEDAP